MSVSFELTMQPRDQLGTGASRRLRRVEGKVPVILYGDGQPGITLSIDHSVLTRLSENEAFYSAILTIQVGDAVYQSILKELKRDPVKPKILHADFLRIDDNKPLDLSVPLHFVGANVAPGVKQSGGVVSYQLTSVALHCLPQHIPEAIVVDIASLRVNEHIMLSQLPLPEGVSLAQGEDRVVVTILAPRGQSTATSGSSPLESAASE
jgi:large subunit ribosomal protein L25